MKYFVAYILLIAILTYGQVMETDFPLFLNISLIVLIFLISFLEEYSIANKNFESDFRIRSQRKKIGGFLLVIATFWTTLIFLNENYKNLIFIVLILWSDPITKFSMYFVYKIKKPYTLFIKDNELILNNRWTQKRNLNELTQIQFDRFSKNLELNFKSKSAVTIKTVEYNVEDIEKLLEIMIEKSENYVFIPQNYESKIKNSC
ncbi:hypothetical protein [Psychroserpens sp. NJDZ02]|uniref:hypothetical protein n=1 Tax=Psychroserpens sp. NJDZ02 TaxID=2570561 RepID=UPI0010A827CB|nr:hypothetical protein [Psychroserpens sp. NJDZ02]QCE43386.1 hypothetical protein E9099_18820 [Psychroserpens sp. NJDZ02]